MYIWREILQFVWQKTKRKNDRGSDAHVHKLAYKPHHNSHNDNDSDLVTRLKTR